jgi:hypothetical protein
MASRKCAFIVWSALGVFALAAYGCAAEGGDESLSGQPLAIQVDATGHDATSTWAVVEVGKDAYRATVTRANDGFVLTVVGGDAVLELLHTPGDSSSATGDVEALWSSHDGTQITSSYPVPGPVSSLDRAMADVRNAKTSRFDLTRLDIVLPVAAVVAERWEAASEPFAADAVALVRDYAAAVAASSQKAEGSVASPGLQPDFISTQPPPGTSGTCSVSCGGDGTSCNATCPNSNAKCICGCVMPGNPFAFTFNSCATCSC